MIYIISLKYVKGYQNIMSLNNLSDKKLKQYYELYKKGLNKTNRFESQKIHNMDVKFLYHLVRLLNEVEQILLEGDLDLERNREQLKAIRKGDWSQEKVEKYFSFKERDLESLYLKSDLPHKAQYDKIRELLFECLAMYFDEAVKPAQENLVNDLFYDMQDLLNSYERRIK